MLRSFSALLKRSPPSLLFSRSLHPEARTTRKGGVHFQLGVLEWTALVARARSAIVLTDGHCLITVFPIA